MTPPLLRHGAVVRLGHPVARFDPQRSLAVVVQADRWLSDDPTLTCCPLTTRMVEAPLLRLPLEPSVANGLPRPAQLMVDKVFTASWPQVRELLGLLQGEELARMEWSLRQWLELA